MSVGEDVSTLTFRAACLLAVAVLCVSCSGGDTAMLESSVMPTSPMLVFGTGGTNAEPGLEALFAEGDELLLSLVWWPAQRSFALQFGPDRLFQFEGDTVRPRGKSAYSRGKIGAMRADLLRDMRAAGR
jgi:hypothetical protein